MSLVAVGGIYLRYALLLLLDRERGRICTIDEMVEGLAALGLTVAADVTRPSKAVSDALRWEVARGRAVRRGRGLYAIGHLPKVTRHRARVAVQHLVRGERPPLCP